MGNFIKPIGNFVAIVLLTISIILCNVCDSLQTKRIDELEQRIVLLDEIMLSSLQVHYMEDLSPVDLHNLLQMKINLIEQEATIAAKRIQRMANANRNNPKQK